MKIQSYLLLSSVLFAFAAHSADPAPTFITKKGCIDFYLASGKNNPASAELYCKDKYIKTAVDVCAEQKLTDYKAQNAAAYVATNEISDMQKFRSECAITTAASTPTQEQLGQTTVQATQAAALQAQQAASAAAALKDKQDAESAAKNAAKKNGQTSALPGLISALEPIAEKFFGDEKKTPAAASKTPSTPFGGNVAAATNSAIAIVDASKKTAPLTGNNNAGTSVDQVNNNLLENNNTIPQQSVLKDKELPTWASSAENYNAGASGQESSAPAATPFTPKASNTSDLQTAKDVATAHPDLEKPVTNALNPPGGNEPPSETGITQTSKSTSNTLKSTVDNTVKSATTSLNITAAGSAAFTKTEGLLQSIQNDVNKYVTSAKEHCISAAEKTEFLCVENSSPGAKATKGLMDAAGPVLAVINSAQKACSSTSKVTGLASAALAAAKGVCVAAKLTCDGLCSSAIADLNKILTDLEGRYNVALDDDLGSSQKMCNISSSTDQTKMKLCESETRTKRGAAISAKNELTNALKNENNVATVGTSPALAKNCEGKIKEIALFAANIAGLLAAKSGADECDKKLSSSGEAGSAVSSTQYCETPINVGTQFCKCQQNSNQLGCPGYIAGNIADKANAAGIAGTNLKTGSGLSAFAGGSKGAANPALSNALDGANRAANADDRSLLNEASGSGGGSPIAGGGLSGNANSNNSSGAEDAEKAADKEKKKWSFGAFASGVGDYFSGGGRGSKNSGENGRLNSKQDAAIQRKIASERLAGEVTAASGKSNWEKVHQVYTIKENSFLVSGQ